MDETDDRGCELPGEDDAPGVTLLLDAYRGRAAAELAAFKASNPAEDAEPPKGWTTRVAAVEGLDAEALSVAHGVAIAADLLEVRVEDPQTGLRYRAKAA